MLASPASSPRPACSFARFLQHLTAASWSVCADHVDAALELPADTSLQAAWAQASAPCIFEVALAVEAPIEQVLRGLCELAREAIEVAKARGEDVGVRDVDHALREPRLAATGEWGEVDWAGASAVAARWGTLHPAAEAARELHRCLRHLPVEHRGPHGSLAADEDGVQHAFEVVFAALLVLGGERSAAILREALPSVAELAARAGVDVSESATAQREAA